LREYAGLLNNVLIYASVLSQNPYTYVRAGQVVGTGLLIGLLAAAQNHELLECISETLDSLLEEITGETTVKAPKPYACKNMEHGEYGEGSQ
jgi:hypothetical protein